MKFAGEDGKRLKRNERKMPTKQGILAGAGKSNLSQSTIPTTLGSLGMNRMFSLLNDASQFRQQAVDVGIAADGDAQAVAVTFIGHVSDQDFSLPELFENTPCAFGRMPAPKEVRLARAHFKAQLGQHLSQPGASN